MNGGASVPAVSTVTWRPAAASAAVSAPISRCSSGSPPVTTTCRSPDAEARATSSATEMRPPSGAHEVYGVSHQAQRRLHPEVRMKNDGTPASTPSPCNDANVSAMNTERFYRVPGASESAGALQ